MIYYLKRRGGRKQRFPEHSTMFNYSSMNISRLLFVNSDIMGSVRSKHHIMMQSINLSILLIY